MNDTLKWVLLTLVAALAVFAGGAALGVDWTMVQVSILGFLETIGLLLLIFSGSVAALEVAKYFRQKNQLLEEEQEQKRAISTSEWRLLVQDAVQEALLERQIEQHYSRDDGQVERQSAPVARRERKSEHLPSDHSSRLQRE